MPIYEYSCQDCGNEFELLIRGQEQAACPTCGKAHLTKAFSVPAAPAGGGEMQQLPCRPSGGMGGCGSGSCGHNH